jgi:DNA-binding transcriptional LysR family regulator
VLHFSTMARKPCGLPKPGASSSRTKRCRRKLHVALLIQVSAKVLSGLVFEELHRYAVCVAAHPAHPLARAREVGLERVANENSSPTRWPTYGSEVQLRLNELPVSRLLENPGPPAAT